MTVILLVEDEALVRMVNADILMDAGYNVIDAANASDALELLDARPDVRLMITDVRMPGELDGYGLSRIVTKKNPGLRVLVISGDSPPGEADLPPGVPFLIKPLSPSALLRAVRDLLGTGADESAVTVTATPVAAPALLLDTSTDPHALGNGAAQPRAEPDGT